MKKLTLLIATAVGVLTTPALLAQMNHGDMGGMNHGDHGAHQSGASAQPHAALPAPVQTVFTNYLKIQTALAQDSLQGVSDSAVAIRMAAQGDSSKTFSADVARAAEDLTKAYDLNVARDVFKRLSGNLITYLEAHKDQAGHFEKVFCSMANARWLQKAGSAVSNPYLGKAESRCGKIES